MSFLFCSAVLFMSSQVRKPKPVIIAYVGGYRGLIGTDSIDVWRLSHINYAFVDIKDNRAWLHNEVWDTINLRKLSELKKISNVYRPGDKEHYTLLFKDLRQNLDSLNQITHMKYYVTTAVGSWQAYIDHTEMEKVQQYADYINVMSYDYADGSDSVSGHHTNLYISSSDSNQWSAHRSIQAFITAGVPPSKIVMGIAFYGKGWQMASADNNGLYSANT